MTAFDLLKEFGHEQLVISQDPGANYVGIVAIHDTTLGPALGGTRLWNYAKIEDALVDALRLARGMTYKSAVAGLPLGGGKSVVIGDPARRDREACFRAHGRFVDTLGGRYITAADVGTSSADMELIHLETEHVAGLPGQSGDPSPVTGYGVYMAMKAAAKARWGNDSLAGKRVAMQGAGKVAQYLARHLHEEGVKLLVTDIDAAKVQRFVADFGAEAVAPGRDLRCCRRHLRTLRAGCHAQRPDHPPAQGRDHLRRGEQPARRAAPRGGGREAGHVLHSRLRGQRRRRDQHLPRDRGLVGGTGAATRRPGSTTPCSGWWRSPSVRR